MRQHAGRPGVQPDVPRQGSRKSGGVRIIYFTRLAAGELWMLLIYPKSEENTIAAHLLKAIREELENG